ncbi:hypothetical protein N7449_010570 [Penicillium cf. viridicatum]|uniref:Uncharacterized protein n=1 Tax=Penicillium cf. viridicatum TaxID=2972119 RepID=A0A9W9J4M2_9EURO|nr:hypothetical protein N7449_010570 [Penicillium cf. viridicatum]
MSDTIDHAGKYDAEHLERQHTCEGHYNDRTQPGLPIVHRTFASPAPLGLLSFATRLHARGVDKPNIFVGVMIFFGGSGIMASYTNNQTGEIAPQFYQALAIYIWAWFILTVLFTVAAMRSSWVLFMDLLVLSLSLLLLASGNMVGSTPLLSSGYCFGLVVAFLSYWAGVAGLWAGETTPIELPTFKMYKDC